MRKAIRTGFWIFGAAVLMILSAAVYWQARLPDEYALTRGGSLRLPGNITAVYGEETAVARSGEATAEAQLRLPLGVSVKTVSVRYVQRDTVLVSGRPFGIKMFTEGLMVVGFTDFSADGRRINPARSAGLATGDILLSLDGITLTSNEQMGALVQGSGGRPVQLVYQRQGRQYTASPRKKAFPTAAGTWGFGCGIAPPASAPSPTLMKTRVPSPAWGIPSAMWIPARS